jgi:hypothetical protein
VFYRAGSFLLRLWAPTATLAAGRALSVLSLCVALVAVWRTSRVHLALGREASAAAILVCLAFLPTFAFGPLNRVDALAAALSVAGLACALEGGWWRKASPLLFVIAIFTKPTAIAAPIAVIIWLLHERQMRAAVWFLASCAGLSLIWTAAEQGASGGGFLASVIGFNRNPMHFAGGMRRVIDVSRSAVLPLSVGIALAAGLRAGGKTTAVALYFLVSVFVATATISKVGAALNYFLEAGMAMSMLAAWALQHWPSLAGRAVALFAAAALLGVAGTEVPAAISSRNVRDSLEDRLRVASRGKYALTSEITTVLQEGGWPVVADPYIFARLSENKQIDQAPLLRFIAHKKADVVITDADLSVPGATNLWTREMCTEVLRHYALQETIGQRAYVYVPRTGEAGVQAVGP